MSEARPSPDEVIQRLARTQQGVMHRRQLLDQHVSYRQIEGRLENRSLIELGHGVYTVPSAPATRLRQYKAAELVVPGGAIAGLAAASLLDLGATRSAAPEIVVHPSALHRCSFARVHRRKDVLITEVQGIRVTTAAQTLVDIVDRLRLARLEEVWTGALVRNRTTLSELQERVEAATAQRLSHRGLAMAMLGSLTDGVELAESELEELLFRVASRIPGVGAIVRQLSLPWWKAGAGRGDVGIPGWRLILEADGRSWHARLRDFDIDRMRDNAAVANGYAVLRFGALHLQRSPDDVAEVIAAAGAHRRTA
jgi:hypothetical protein